jgi:hypothetical protein
MCDCKLKYASPDKEGLVQSNLVIPDLAIPDYIHFPPYTGELSKTEQGLIYRSSLYNGFFSVPPIQIFCARYIQV